MTRRLIRNLDGQAVPLPQVLQATGASAGRPIAGNLVIGDITVKKDGAAGPFAAGVGTLTDHGSGLSTYKPTAAETDFVETLVINADPGGNAVPVSAQCVLAIGDYDGGVWIDTDGSNTNTTPGKDGTRQNPVSTVTAAKTLADALGFKKYFISGSIVAALGGGSHVGWIFEAVDSFPSIDVNNINTNNAIFRAVQVKGTMAAPSTDGLYDRCIIASPTNMRGGVFLASLLQGTLVLANSQNASFLDCYSGTGSDAVILDVGNKDTVSIVGHNGKIILDSVTGAGTRVDVAFNSGDELEILATSTNGTVKPSGPVALTDNSGAGCTVDLASAVLIADGSQAANVDKWQDVIIDAPAMIENSTGGRWTTKALEQAPSGGGGLTQQDVRDAMALPTADTIQSGSIDDKNDQIFARTDVATSTRSSHSAADVANAIGTRTVESGATYDQSMRLQNAAAGGETSGAETTNFKVRDLADTKDRIDATTDEFGNRAAVTRDLS